MRRPLWSSAEYCGVRGVEHDAASRGVPTSDHREALERGLGRLTARTPEETVALHVTSGAGPNTGVMDTSARAASRVLTSSCASSSASMTVSRCWLAGHASLSSWPGHRDNVP